MICSIDVVDQLLSFFSNVLLIYFRDSALFFFHSIDFVKKTIYHIVSLINFIKEVFSFYLVLCHLHGVNLIAEQSSRNRVPGTEFPEQSSRNRVPAIAATAPSAFCAPQLLLKVLKKSGFWLNVLLYST